MNNRSDFTIHRRARPNVNHVSRTTDVVSVVTCEQTSCDELPCTLRCSKDYNVDSKNDRPPGCSLPVPPEYMNYVHPIKLDADRCTAKVWNKTCSNGIELCTEHSFILMASSHV